MASQPQTAAALLKQYNSFSGADVNILFAMPSAPTSQNENPPPITRVMTNVQTLSYSVFREKSAARSLGFVGEKGRARGTRTIAGSIVFTVFDRHPMFDLMRLHPNDAPADAVTPTGLANLSYVHPDQLPPFDIIIHFANEYGSLSELVLFGVEFSSEGQVHSVQDMLTENVMQYTARHVAIMRPGGFLEAYVETPAGRSSKKTFESIMRSKHSGDLQTLVEKSHNPFR
jgi:hypothetical protein